MGSLEFAPPYECCGGMAFHAKWCTGSDAPARADAFTPSPFRFAWQTRNVPPGASQRVEQGAAFQAVRVLYGLTLREVADGWRVPHVEVGELERGLRHFASPADMHAALQQLWCWANEKRPSISSAPAPRS